MYYVNKVLAFIARNIKKAIMLAVIVIIIALSAVTAYDAAFHFVVGDKVQTYDPDGETVMLTIPKGSTAKDISEILEKNGVVKSATKFRWRAKVLGTENDFKYGTYSFVIGMPDEEIMKILSSGAKQESVRITIPEGWTIEQMADYLQEKEICLKEEFIAACNVTTYDFDYYTYDMLSPSMTKRRNLLEGYLFPNTYDVIPENGAEGVVTRLLRQFEVELTDSDKERMKELGLTTDQVVTMASVIEKEAKLDEERPKVAAVLYNRMEQNMPWQLNSTVLYALGRESAGSDNLTYADIAVDSKYNTYKYAGYPLGPICCPGKASIEAVLYPAEIDALYFVLKDDGSNSHFFTADYDAFLRARDGDYSSGESVENETGEEGEEGGEEGENENTW